MSGAEFGNERAIEIGSRLAERPVVAAIPGRAATTGFSA